MTAEERRHVQDVEQRAADLERVLRYERERSTALQQRVLVYEQALRNAYRSLARDPRSRPEGDA